MSDLASLWCLFGSEKSPGPFFCLPVSPEKVVNNPISQTSRRVLLLGVNLKFSTANTPWHQITGQVLSGDCV